MDQKQKPLLLQSTELTEEILLKAQKELNETSEKRTECLETLRSLIRKNKIHCSNLNDEFLLRFLRVKKFDSSKAAELLQSYCHHREKYPDLYEPVSPSTFQILTKANYFNFLPYRTDEGCAIWVSRFGLWDPDAVSFDDTLKFGLACMEKVSQNPVTQICGVVNIIDLQGMSIKHLLHVSPAKIYRFITAIQDSFPLRQKATHIVNNQSIFSFIYAFAQPLLKEKIRNSIFFHSFNMDSLHQHVPPTLLPEEFGGGPWTFQNDNFYYSLTEKDDSDWSKASKNAIK